MSTGELKGRRREQSKSCGKRKEKAARLRTMWQANFERKTMEADKAHFKALQRNTHRTACVFTSWFINYVLTMFYFYFLCKEDV